MLIACSHDSQSQVFKVDVFHHSKIAQFLEFQFFSLEFQATSVEDWRLYVFNGFRANPSKNPAFCHCHDCVAFKVPAFADCRSVDPCRSKSKSDRVKPTTINKNIKATGVLEFNNRRPTFRMDFWGRSIGRMCMTQKM